MAGHLRTGFRGHIPVSGFCGFLFLLLRFRVFVFWFCGFRVFSGFFVFLFLRVPGFVFCGFLVYVLCGLS